MPKTKANREVQTNTSRPPDELVTELRSIKMLLVLLLAKLGSQSGEIAKAMGISDSTLRNWISLRDVEKIPLPKAK